MIRKVLNGLLFSVAVLCMVGPLIYWFQHAELTEMQLTQKFWPAIIIGNVCFWLSIVNMDG